MSGFEAAPPFSEQPWDRGAGHGDAGVWEDALILGRRGRSSEAEDKVLGRACQRKRWAEQQQRNTGPSPPEWDSLLCLLTSVVQAREIVDLSLNLFISIRGWILSYFKCFPWDPQCIWSTCECLCAPQSHVKTQCSMIMAFRGRAFGKW